jgi:hypothetical protein
MRRMAGLPNLTCGHFCLSAKNRVQNVSFSSSTKIGLAKKQKDKIGVQKKFELQKQQQSCASKVSTKKFHGLTLVSPVVIHLSSTWYGSVVNSYTYTSKYTPTL